VPEEQLSPATHDAIFDYFCFCLPPGEQMAGYPVRRLDGQGPRREYNIIWYRPLDGVGLDHLLTDASGRRHEMNIPPPLIKPSIKAKVKDDAERTLSPQFAEAVRITDGIFCQPIYDVEVPAMVQGRVARLGDGAGVARPHVGAGVTKGFSDALALTRALGRAPSVPTALAEYERDRLPVGRAILQRARQLGAYMQASNKTEEERRFAEMHRDPEAVLRETASLDFMKNEGVPTVPAPAIHQQESTP
jgi:2-polyprenyl-6-methoxyphenol hydroxylase-like FAD-dependent oxidoreductase